MLLTIGIILFLILLGLLGWRFRDEQETKKVWAELKNTKDYKEELFDPTRIETLPEPAKRFFRFAIKEGTPIHPIIELDMSGEFSLGSKEKPNYMPMTAKQIISPPHGFIWKVSAGSGLMRFVGSDACHPDGSWSRFWLFGFIPIARAGGNKDHKLSSFGRYMSEAVFWLPSAVFPSENIVWQKLGPDHAQATITHNGMELIVELIVDKQGAPTTIRFQRWTNANPEGVFRMQHFGGYLSDFKNFDGYMLPTSIEAGNNFGTNQYFPFFKVKVLKIDFPR
ncbi:MAG TPA: hypothetical protein P5227_09295 [Emcibacteraceae bacterium]|nr:hypothetical protein [Emcibacteraceae bacterium]